VLLHFQHPISFFTATYGYCDHFSPGGFSSYAHFSTIPTSVSSRSALAPAASFQPFSLFGATLPPLLHLLSLRPCLESPTNVCLQLQVPPVGVQLLFLAPAAT
jgi:hypothetical protein